MNIAVIVLNWNQSADTLACLRMLRAWSLAPRQIWVVDNASREEDRAQLEVARHEAQFIYNDVNLGFAGGNNRALPQVLARDVEAVLLLNNDATLDRVAVEHMLSVIHAAPNVAIVGAQIFDADAPARLLAAGGRDIALHLSSHIMDPLRAGELRDCDYVPGTCALISARVLREVGLLDKDYFFGGEVAAWCQSVRQLGFRCVVDGDARALHSERRSARARQSLHAYYIIRNRFLFASQFHPNQRTRLYLKWTGISLYLTALALTQRNLPRARAVLLGCVDGWAGRYGGQNARVTRGAVT